VSERSYYVYIIASRTRVLYTGITSEIESRMKQHKTKYFAGFTADYNCCRLVWYESYDDPNRAIAREKQIKRWIRVKKIALIHKMNPTWIDLSENWGKPLQSVSSANHEKGNAGPFAHSTRRAMLGVRSG
jgi:putative endonuclease